MFVCLNYLLAILLSLLICCCLYRDLHVLPAEVLAELRPARARGDLGGLARRLIIILLMIRVVLVSVIVTNSKSTSTSKCNSNSAGSVWRRAAGIAAAASAADRYSRCSRSPSAVGKACPHSYYYSYSYSYYYYHYSYYHRYHYYYYYYYYYCRKGLPARRARALRRAPAAEARRRERAHRVDPVHHL